MWFIEKGVWFDNNWDSTKAGYEQSTMEEQVEASSATERMAVGATAFIGNATPEQVARLNYITSKAAADAKARGASDVEIEAIMMDVMQGEIRLDQAVQDLNNVIKILNPQAGRASVSEGMYMGQAEPNIDAEVVFDKDTDISTVVDEVIKIGMNNDQHSVFVSKTTNALHPNARPFVRFEFTESLSEAEINQMSDILRKNGIDGFSIHKNQQGEIIGLSFQFIPEFLMDQGLTLENVKEFENKHLQNTAKSIAEIQSIFGDGIFNTVEKGHVNTKIFTNGEYETIKSEEKSFKTDIQTELARRARAIDYGDGSKDIVDKRTGDAYDARSIQRFHILNEFADKLKDLRKALGSSVYSDPFMITPTIKAGLFVMEKTLRATSNIATSIDAGINYIKANLKEGEKFTKTQENQIRSYFKNEIESNQRPGGIDINKEADLEGNQEISEEEMYQREKDSDTLDVENMIEQESTRNEIPSEQDLIDPVIDEMIEDISSRTRAKMSGGKRNAFSRFFEYVRSGRFRDDAMIQLVDPKYVIKKRLQQLADQYEIGEAEFEALSQLTLWLQVPGAAKSEVDMVNSRLWRDENNQVVVGGRGIVAKKMGKALTKEQIEKVGKLNSFERIIQLDQLSDQNKVVIDSLIKEINKSKDPVQIKQIKDQLSTMLDPETSRMGLAFENGKYKLIAKDAEGNTVDVPPGIKYKGDLYHRRMHPKAKGEQAINKEYAEKMIERMKDTDTDFELIKRKSDQVFDEYKRILKEDYDAGLISEELYNELKDINYSPRKFVDYLIFSERNILNQRRDNQYRVDGIDKYMKTLKHGSDGVLYTDPVQLLQQRIALAHKLRFENDARKGILDFITMIEQVEQGNIDPVKQKRLSNLFGVLGGESISIRDAIGHTIKPGESVNPNTHIEVQAMVGGQKVKFAMTIEAYRSFIASPHDTDIQSLGGSNWISRILKGSLAVPGRILKTFATGVGAPTFFISNVLLDFTQQTHMTDTYSGGFLWWRNFLPIKYGMAFGDWVAMSRDAMTGGPMSQEYARLGGNLEYFTAYGRGNYGDVMEVSQGNISARVKQLMEQEGLSEASAVEQAIREEKAGAILKTESDPFTNPDSRGAWETFKSGLSAINQWSETLGRLANMRRWQKTYIAEYKKKNNGAEPTGIVLERIKKRAVANAVETANFNNGGKSIKTMDKMGASYLNAVWQVMYRGAKHVKRNPMMFAYESAQFGLIFGASLVAFNLRKYNWDGEEDEEEIQKQLEFAKEENNKEETERLERYLIKHKKYYLDFIPDYEKDRYHIVITGWNDKTGKPVYWRIRKDERLSLMSAPFEDLAYREITGKDYNATGRKSPFNYVPVIGPKGSELDLYARRFQNALPPGLGNWRDGVTSFPILNLISKTAYNYDNWRDREVWRGDSRVMGHEQFLNEGDTDDKILRDASEMLHNWNLVDGGFNVTQWKEGLGSIFTNLDKNVWYQVIDNTYIAATNGLSDDEKLEYGSMFDKMFQESVPSLFTNKLINTIDLTRPPKSEKQYEIDSVLMYEKNRDGVFNLAYKEAARKLGYRKNSDGVWTTPNGTVLKDINYQGEVFDNLVMEIGNATERYYNLRMNIKPEDSEVLSEDVKEYIFNRVRRDLKYSWVENNDMQRVLHEFDRGNKETAAFIAFTMYRDLKEGKIDQEEWARWVQLEGDFNLWEDDEYNKYYDLAKNTYNNEVKK